MSQPSCRTLLLTPFKTKPRNLQPQHFALALGMDRFQLAKEKEKQSYLDTFFNLFVLISTPFSSPE